MKQKLVRLLLAVCLALGSALSFGESQGSEYKGVSDPFGDPANYEFAEDEKEDKEFFHLGRYLMLGLDVGAGIFTGGLGRSNTPGFMFGGRLVYFFDKAFAFEGAVHFSMSTDTLVSSVSANDFAKIDTRLIPITFGFRYYFDTKNAPRAIAIANPYLVGGGGIYLRNQDVLSQTTGLSFNETSSSTNSFGGFLGAGAEFNVYRKHIYLGADFRYHFVFFPDEDETYGGKVLEGERSGDFFSSLLTITYNY